ncbi:MAG: hypothetical protein U0Z44_09400 [Kouleothrix sp.]
MIKGSAINNDGAQKVGYTAPSVEGQARVIRAAQRSPRSRPIDRLCRAHGTGTPLGDRSRSRPDPRLSRRARRCTKGARLAR